ncbi:MAG TPA: DUF6789 family protein [Gemmataceae bacterium]|jgi:hypothetical protein|nr:DUF6789 family protein [Gemmataceae bacterium]
MKTSAGFFFAGAVAGCVATVPMTAAMRAIHRRLPPHERDPLPPAQVTVNAAEIVGVAHKLSRRQKQNAFLAAHYGVGTAAGAFYGVLAPSLPGPGLLNGAAYGLTVWASSYLGVLPATGLYKPPDRESARRHGMTAAAHVVWGGVLGALMDLLLPEREVRS